VNSKRWTLIAVIIGSGVVFLESSIVAAALPKIGEELSSSLVETLEAQSYVYYVYLLALSALLILGGALTDYRGRKRMFLLGLAGFGFTSILCGIAPNMEFLIVARILQGASGALLVPGSLSIITATFEGEEQGRAFGVWAGASAATTILGPVVGGALVAYVSWRAAFLINVPILVAAAWITWKHMSETRDEQATGKFDWWGAVVVAAAVGGLTFGAIRGQSQEWSGAVPFVALGIGVAATIAFPILMARSDHPLVPLDLFKSRNFRVTNISTLLIYGAIYVLIQFMALFTVGVLGYNEVGFGIATIPTTIFLALFSTRFGALADRYGPRAFMTLGPLLMGAGLLWFTRIPRTSAAWAPDPASPSSFVPPRDYLVDVLPALVVFGAGLMVMVAPLTTALMRSVPVRHSGVTSAFNNAISRVGPQLAGALIFVVISATFYAGLEQKVGSGVVGGRSIRELASPLNPPAVDAPARVKDAADEASTDAFQIAMLIAALLCFGGALVNGLGIVNTQQPEAASPGKPVTPCAQSPHVEAPVGSRS
jgi:EmrB/QacA subfamily drug resistance transporter